MYAPRTYALKQLVNHPLTRLAVAASLLALLCHWVDPGPVMRRLRAAPAETAALLVLCHGLVLGLSAWRWCLIANRLGIAAPAATYPRAIWTAAFLAQFGPALVINELIRFQALRGAAPAHRLAWAQFTDRLSGQAALVFIALPGLTSLPPAGFNLPLLGVTIAALLVAGGALWRRLEAHRRHAVLRLVDPRHAAPHLAVSLAVQLLLAGSLVVAAQAVAAPIDLPAVARCAPLVLLGVGLLPVSPADWGTREVMALAVLGIAGLSPEQAAAASVLYGLSHTLATLPGAWLVLRTRR